MKIDSRMRRVIIYFLFILSFCLRLYFVVMPPPYQTELKADAIGYDAIAWNLALGRGFSLDGLDTDNPEPTTFRVPLYPLFLSLIYRLFGHNYFVVRVIQALLGALTCVIVYLISRNIFDYKIGLLTFVVMATYPPFISWLYYGGANFLLAETVFIFLFALAMLWMSKFARNKRTFEILLSGVFLGAAILTKPIVLLFPLFITGWIIYTFRTNLKRALKNSVVFIFSFCLILSPWVLRNYIVTDQISLAFSHFGIPFWQGNNSAAKGGIIGHLSSIPEYDENELRGLSEAEKNRIYIKKGIEYLLKHPRKVPYLFFKKLLVHWNIFNGNNRLHIFYSIILSFAIIEIGLALKLSRMSLMLPIISLLIYSTFMAIVVAGDPRYRYPIEPYLIVLASAGFLHLWRTKLHRIYKTGLIAGILLVNLLFMFFSEDILSVVRRIL